jgi:hypothetical protein
MEEGRSGRKSRGKSLAVLVTLAGKSDAAYRSQSMTSLLHNCANSEQNRMITHLQLSPHFALVTTNTVHDAGDVTKMLPKLLL